MHRKAYGLIPLVIFSTGVFADHLALEDAAKRLLKDSATTTAPAETDRAVDSANRSVEKAKNLKESMERAPATLQSPAAPESGKPPAADASKDASASEKEKAGGPRKSSKHPRGGHSRERQPR